MTWIPHTGGPCPVPAGTRVRIKFHDGETVRGLASEFEWKHYCGGKGGDIIAYRILEPSKAEPCPACEAWDWLSGQHDAELSYCYGDDFRDPAWQVYLVHGGRNDREWRLISEAETPLEAVLAARAASLLENTHDR